MQLPAPPRTLDLYRADGAGERGMVESVREPLGRAGEALHLALLTLTSDASERSNGLLEARAAQARACLLEAAVALGTARVVVPSIRTYSMAVVMSSEPRVHGELTRLYQLTTQLLWWNIHLLPARRRAQPLAPEDEAQLDVVIQGLARTAKIDRLLEYSWLGLMVLLAALGPLYGVPMFSIFVAAMATAIAVWKLAKMQRDSLALTAG